MFTQSIVLIGFVFAAASLGAPGQDLPTESPAGEVAQDRDRAGDGGADLDPERALLRGAREAIQGADYALARTRITTALESLRSRAEEQRDEVWLDLLVALGQAAWKAHDLPVTRDVFEEVLAIRTRTLPPDHFDLQIARTNLAIALKRLGDPRRAEALEQAALEVYSRNLPLEHPDVDLVRGNLAVTKQMRGDLAGARALYESVLEVRERTLPADHPMTLNARSNLSGLLQTLGEHGRARALDEQVLEVRTRTLHPDDPDLQASRSNLAGLLREAGELERARALDVAVLESLARTLPDEHPDLVAARNNLASSLLDLGDLSGARALAEQVLEVRSRNLPADHLELQSARTGLAAVLRLQEEYDAARALQELALEVLERTVPPDHDLRQRALQNAAQMRALAGDFAGALEGAQRLLDLRSWTLAETHPLVLEAKLVLAGIRSIAGDPDGARTLLEQVLAARVANLPEDHPELRRTRSYLFQVIALGHASRPAGEAAADEQDRLRCVELVAANGRSATRAAREAILTGSRREAEERCASLTAGLDTVLSLVAGYGVFETSPELVDVAFVLSEATRGAALASAALARRAADSPRLAELRRTLRRRSETVVERAQHGTSSGAFQQALARREALERELVALARELTGTAALGVELDARSLGAVLRAGEAAVAYRSYHRHAFERAAEGEVGDLRCGLCAPWLAAFVVRPDGTVVLVELGPMDAVEAATLAWRSAIGVGTERGLGMQTGVDSIVTERGRELRRLVLDPILAELGETRRLVLVVDDVLHLVPLDALPLEEGEGAHSVLVGERLVIELRSSLGELLEPVPRPRSSELVLALGGASFNSEPLGPSAEDLSVAELAAPGRADEVAMVLRGGAWERGFTPLTYSRQEVHGIAALHEEVFGTEHALVLDRRKASRESLVELAPKARWLHVATHGWYAAESMRSWHDPDPLDQHSGLGLRASGEAQVRGSSPMLLSGLALAGANLPESAPGRVPGLMTAEELATLELGACELAVLSACDTHVGQRRAGQGVASLQRALQMAGARSVITSLWKVPDEATSELMLDFYRRLWVERKPKHQALWEAKLRLRDAVDERGQPLYTVRDWAAWVLTGEPD